MNRGSLCFRDAACDELVRQSVREALFIAARAESKIPGVRVLTRFDDLGPRLSVGTVTLVFVIDDDLTQTTYHAAVALGSSPLEMARGLIHEIVSQRTRAGLGHYHLCPSIKATDLTHPNQ